MTTDGAGGALRLRRARHCAASPPNRDGRPTRVLHLLGSAQHPETSLAHIVRVLARWPRPDYELAAWFTGEDGPGPVFDELRELGIDTKMSPWAGFRDREDLTSSVGLVRALRRGGFDIVHRHVGGRALPWIVRLGGVAHIVSQASTEAPEAPGSFAPLRSYRRFETVLAVSQAVAGTVACDARVLHLGARLPIAPPRSGPLVVGAAGRLVRAKGHHHLLDAFAALAVEFPDATLELAGDGQEHDALVTQARRLGVERRVRFLGWRTDMRAAYAAWDIVVQPSLHEGFGLTVLEAMSSGLPVIASATGGLRELVIDGTTGMLVLPGDQAALADRLIELARSPQLRRTFGLAGRARAEAWFAPEAMAAKIFDVYDELMGRTGGPRTVQRRLAATVQAGELASPVKGSPRGAPAGQLS